MCVFFKAKYQMADIEYKALFELNNLHSLSMETLLDHNYVYTIHPHVQPCAFCPQLFLFH